jgi:hemoglobin
MAVGPLLDHRPELKAAVEKVLQDTNSRQLSVQEKAFALRKVMDDVRAAITRDQTPPPKLWDRLGGEKAIRAIIRDASDAAVKDPKVDATRGGKYKFTEEKAVQMEQAIVEWVSSVTGGPLEYKGKDLKTIHAGMHITDAQFNALLGHLTDALKKHMIPEREAAELLKLIGDTRKDIVDNTPPPPPLWERLGGEKAVKAVVHDFVETASQDPKVNWSRDGKFKLTDLNRPLLEVSLLEFISSVTGGPLKYIGKDMKAAHAGMGITDDEFNAAAKHLVDALKKHKVGQKEIDEMMLLVESTRKDIVEKPAEKKEEGKPEK